MASTGPVPKSTTRKPSRQPAPECANPLCDKLADSPHALSMTQASRGPWVTCGPECAVTFLRLSLIRVEARADRAAVEAEAER